MSKPTFDEWYRGRMGNPRPMMDSPQRVRLQIEALATYVSEMVQPEAEAKITAAPTLYSDTELQMTGAVIDRGQPNPQWNIYAAADAERNAIHVDRRTPPLTWKTEQPVYEDLVAAVNRMYGWTEPDLVSAYTVCSVRERPVHHQHYEPIGDEV